MSITQADLNALEQDAQTWDGVAEDLGSAASAASQITLDTGALSWAAEVVGLTSTYADYLTFVSDRLDQGQQRTGQIAEGLRTVKRSYESTDASVRDDFVGLWDAT